MVDISLAMPAIRTHNWLRLIESIWNSCKKHTWEIIFAGPFYPPKELASMKNVGFVKTYACPSTATQLAVAHSRGELLMCGLADDSIFLEDRIDEEISHLGHDTQTIINMRYTEGKNHQGKPPPDSYWQPSSYPQFQTLAGIPQQGYLI